MSDQGLREALEKIEVLSRLAAPSSRAARVRAALTEAGREARQALASTPSQPDERVALKRVHALLEPWLVGEIEHARAIAHAALANEPLPEVDPEWEEDFNA